VSNRAADASIRGYFAQVARSALEWARLGADEQLVIEGREDFDRELRNGESLIAIVLHQHKTQAAKVGWSAEVQQSVLGFVASFARCHADGVACSPMYVSTSSMAEAPVVRMWTAPSRSATQLTALAAQIAADLRAHALLGERSAFAAAARAGVEYLDAAPERWEAFVSATRWVFDANDHQADLRELARALKEDRTAAGMPPDQLSLRVLVSVFEVAMNPDLNNRTLKRSDLAALIQAQRDGLQAWADSTEAAVFFDALDLDTLLAASKQRVDLELRRGTIDRQGGPRAPRLGPEAELRKDAPLRIVVGERGSGKTSVVAKWAADELAHDRPVVWLSCRTGADTPDEFFRAHNCRRGPAVLDMLKRRHVPLILDALDQGRTAPALKALCDLVSLAVDAGVRTVAVVRLRHAETDRDVRRLLSAASRIDVGPFSDVELGALAASPATPASLSRLPHALAPQLRRLLELPLHVHLLWELARTSENLDLRSIVTLAQLMAHYWTDVVKTDGDDLGPDGVLHMLVSRMVDSRKLTARVVDPGAALVLHKLVKAEVLSHPSVRGFGETDDQFTFSFDAVFDYAVFRLLWRSASDAEVIDSLRACGSFGAGLDQSFRYLLEHREAEHGADGAVQLASLAFASTGLDEATTTMVAAEFAAWLAGEPARQRSLVSLLRRAPGARDLLRRIAPMRLGAS
jgi:hypothetical protein